MVIPSGRLCAWAAAALALGACKDSAPTGIELVLEYSRPTAEVTLSALYSDETTAFSARTFSLPPPSGELERGTILILLPADRAGSQLRMTLTDPARSRSIFTQIVAETIVQITVDLTCGDGLLLTSELCDDGNVEAGDGCDGTCLPEQGFLCGDGLTRGIEECDDVNRESGDGCARDCTFEPGWTCDRAEPTACTADCGDGAIVGPETCDDGDQERGDGCDGTCSLELDWTCTGTPSMCKSCGNGRFELDEACDDGDRDADDGCDPTCAIELGWTCTSTPSVCVKCGNGVLEAGEACDDGASEAGDGCDPSCRVERGYGCTGSPSECDPICGDGLLRGVEACDVGPPVQEDGCDDRCMPEPGFLCARIEPSRCYPEADVVFVDAAGPSCPGSSGNGTEMDPYCTIILGVGASRPAVFVDSGRYNGKVTIDGRVVDLVATGSATIAVAMDDALDIGGASTVGVYGFAIAGSVKVDGASEASFFDCDVGPSTGLGVRAMGPGTYVRIERSFIHDNAGGGVKLDGDGGGHDLINNVIVRNGGVGGVEIKRSTPTARFVNNTVADNMAGGGSPGAIICTVAARIDNSIVWNSPGSEASGIGDLCDARFSVLTSTPAVGANNLYLDPLLVGPRYHLDPASPAIDAADPGPAPPLDVDRDPRPQGGGVDIGADEARRAAG